MKTSILVLFTAFIVSGCISPGNTISRFNKADDHAVTNEKYFEQAPGVVWDILVRELSKSFFMINNIDKESRIINVSFSSNNTCDYVDCGEFHIDVKKSSLNKTGNSSYYFGICESNSYISEGSAPNQSGIPAPIICLNTRRPNLEGRMNIYIAPKGNGTLVSVNSRYILEIKLKAECDFYAPAGNLVNKGREESSYVCSFDSRRPELCQPLKGEPFMCHSKGTLENEILSLIIF